MARALDEARQEIRRLRALFDRAPVGLIELTPDGIVKAANDTANRLLGVGELCGATSLNTRIFSRSVCHELQQLCQGHCTRVSRTFPLERPGQETIWLQVIGELRRSSDGQPETISLVVTEIEAPDKPSGARWADTGHQYYEAMFRQNTAPKLLIDPADGTIVDANPAALGFYGYSLARIRRMHIHEINTLTEAELHAEHELLLREGRRFYRFRHRLADGQIRDVEVYSSTLRIEGRDLLLSIIHDVTNNRRYQEALEAYKTIFDSLPVGVYSYRLGRDGHFTKVNPAMARIFNAPSRAALLAQPVSQLYRDPSQRHVFTRELASCRTIIDRELSLRKLDGELLTASVTAHARTNAAGETIFEGIIEDISKRKELEAELRLLATAFQTSQAIMITDADLVIRRVNPAFSQITGYLAEEAIGRKPSFLASGRHTPTFYQNLWQALNEQDHWEGEVWNHHKSGEIYPLWESITAVRDEEGRIEHYISVFHDIIQQKRLEAELAHLASHDRLTGLYNRRRIYDLLDNARKAYVRYGTPFSIIMFDIDHFKQINDMFGHLTGDAVLRELASRVQGTLRELDHVGRWGGEEFMVLAGHTDLAGAEQLAERIRHAIERRPFDGIGTVTVSLGVATIVDDDEELPDLEKKADRALYAAKNSGRNRTCVSRDKV